MLRIRESLLMVDQVEDWSRVRSPSRAARRRFRHKQNIDIKFVPRKEAIQIDGELVMHPEMARVLRERLLSEQAIRPPSPIDQLNPGYLGSPYFGGLMF